VVNTVYGGVSLFLIRLGQSIVVIFTSTQHDVSIGQNNERVDVLSVVREGQMSTVWY